MLGVQLVAVFGVFQMPMTDLRVLLRKTDRELLMLLLMLINEIVMQAISSSCLHFVLFVSSPPLIFLHSTCGKCVVCHFHQVYSHKTMGDKCEMHLLLNKNGAGKQNMHSSSSLLQLASTTKDKMHISASTLSFNLSPVRIFSPCSDFSIFFHFCYCTHYTFLDLLCITILTKRREFIHYNFEEKRWITQ